MARALKELRQRGKKGVYYTDFFHNGQRIRRPTGEVDPDRAKQFLDTLKANLWNEAAGAPTGRTLNDCLVLWLKLKPRTANEKNAIKLFLKIFPNRSLDAITGTDIFDALLDKGAAHANRILTIIRAAINLGVARDWCKPKIIARRKAPKGRVSYLSWEQWQALCHELPWHVKLMAHFSVMTGLRKSNVYKLRWENVDMGRQVAWVHADDAKGGVDIPVPINDEAMETLRAVQGDHSEYVFTYKGKPINSAKTAFNKALARIGIDDFTWHDLRHTWAIWHVRNGTPLPVLKDLGGWADLSQVQVYAKFSPSHLQNWANNSSQKNVTTEMEPA